MNYYEILEIDKNSNSKEIKKHYYKLSKKYHPDKNNNISDEKFKYLSEAYSILSNPKKRYLYDIKLFLIDNNINYFGIDIIDNFSDKDLELIYNYYLKLSNSTEFKFLKLLYKSLPKKIIRKFKKKINSYSLINIRDIKYIDIRKLYETFEITLNRSLKDVYLNSCKELILIANNFVYYLFITHSDYTIIINNNNNLLKINIVTILSKNYSLNGNDLYYDFHQNLYEYYFNENINIKLPDNNDINIINNDEFNKSIIIPRYGIKNIDNSRGNLYIYKNLNLYIKNKNNYKQIIKEIFT